MDISGAGQTAVSRWKKQYIDEINVKTPVGVQAMTTDQVEFIK